MKSLKEWALYYVSLGFAVFPLKPESKYPATVHGFEDASSNKTDIEKWWNINPNFNIGIATGQKSNGLIVIDLDFDEEKGINGYETLKDWELKNGKLPETWRSITGRGGCHLFYKSNVKAYRCHTNWYEGIDIRADGGYIVAPPSIHPDTQKKYEWEQNEEDGVSIADVTMAVDNFLDKSSEEKKTNFMTPDYIGAHERNNTLYKLACSMRARGDAEEAIKAALEVTNRTRCYEPLSQKELDVIFNSAMKQESGTAPYKVVLDNGKFRPVKERKNLVYKTAKELLESDLPPVEFVVDSILAKGLVVVSAKSKYGKSWLMLQLAIAVASGKKFLGFNTKKGNVLYIDLENSESVSRERLTIALEGEDPPEDLILINDYSTMNDTFIEDLSEYLEEHKNTSLVIIDVFQRIKKQKRANQSDYEDIYQSFTPLKELTSKYNISLVLIMHDRKMNDPTDPFNNVLGSTAIMGASDQMIVLQKKERKAVEATLHITGRTVQESDYVLRFNKPLWVMVGDADSIAEEKRRAEYENSPIVKTIRKLVNANGGRYIGTTTEIIEASKMMQGCRIYDNAQKCGLNIKKLIPLLEQFDAIEHFAVPNGNASSKHEFKKIFV